MIKNSAILLLLNVFISSVSFAEEDSKKDPKRVYLRLSSMFSGEVALGYEQRVSDVIGISAGIEGGFHAFDTVGTSLNHVGPEVGVALYAFQKKSAHQLYLMPLLSVIYGNLKGKKDFTDKYTLTPHLLAARLKVIGGYRYNFTIPLALEVGLGVDALSVVVPLNERPVFPFAWPLPFVHFGLSYLF